MILSCSCEHNGQDKLHGPGMRVHNMVPEQGGTPSWRCTVCTTVRSASVKAEGKKKKKK